MRRRTAIFLVVATMGLGRLRSQTDSTDVEILAFGDVNLGRRVGQVILRGDTLYPVSICCGLAAQGRSGLRQS